jgi:acetyl esterase/lipase
MISSPPVSVRRERSILLVSKTVSTMLLAALTAMQVAALRADPLAAPVRLWPGTAPGERGAIAAEEAKTNAAGKVTSLTNVSEPTLTIYPAAGKSTGVGIVVAPGGGYRNLAWDHEGDQLGRWFSEHGIAAFVLKYRVPRREHDPDDKLPLMDAQRAMGLVRAHAKEWGVQPQKLGFLGFSAGGHLTAHLSNNFDRRAYDPVDAADQQSCKPDFAVLIYPGGLIRRESTSGELRAGVQPGSQTPPSFVVVASDDKGSFESSVRYFAAAREAGVKSELHVYTAGGHGFGIRPQAGKASSWTERCLEWLQTIGVL